MQSQREMKWSRYLKLFSEENRNRLTRIAVYEGQPGSMLDYWLEDGLPLAAIDLDPNGDAGPEIEIMLDNRPITSAHMTHGIIGVRAVRITMSATGEADGIEIENNEGVTTVLQFENPPVKD